MLIKTIGVKDIPAKVYRHHQYAWDVGWKIKKWATDNGFTLGACVGYSESDKNYITFIWDNERQIKITEAKS